MSSSLSNLFQIRKTSFEYSRTKRSTISLSNELIDSESYYYHHNDGKTNTLSKVKRFGSMLIRGKKSARPSMHVVTSPRVDTANLPISNSSTASLTHSSSDEENLETPVEAVTPKDIPSTEPTSSEVSPDSISTDTTEENSIFPHSADENEHRLNLALLVQCQLHNAFDQIDAEIEIEIDQSRKRMLKTISYVPPLYSH